MPMTHIPLSGLETETDSVSSKTSTLQDIVNPSVVSNTQRDILQIIRKEEDHAMSLLATSPLLSSLFLTYANRAATLDGPPNPSPIDIEWVDMKTMNDRLQEEVASLQAQLDKETDRAKTAEDCVEALRAQLSSVKRANRDLEAVVSDERTRLEAVTSEYAEYKKEAGNAIAELRITVDKEAAARAALSQVIADQQIALAQLKEQNESSLPSPTIIKEYQTPVSPRISRAKKAPKPEKSEDTTNQADANKHKEDPKREDSTGSDHSDDENKQDATGHRELHRVATGQDVKPQSGPRRGNSKAGLIGGREADKAGIASWF